MGYMRHHAIIVTSSNGVKIIKARKKALEIFPPNSQVSNIVESVINDEASFFIGPDGSKEGWDTSHEGDNNRAQFINWLNKQRYDDNSSSLSWVEVQYGDDNLETKICNDNDARIRREGYKE